MRLPSAAALPSAILLPAPRLLMGSPLRWTLIARLLRLLLLLGALLVLCRLGVPGNSIRLLPLPLLLLLSPLRLLLLAPAWAQASSLDAVMPPRASTGMSTARAMAAAVVARPAEHAPVVQEQLCPDDSAAWRDWPACLRACRLASLSRRRVVQTLTPLWRRRQRLRPCRIFSRISCWFPSTAVIRTHVVRQTGRR